MIGDCCVSRFLQRSVNGKDLMRFQSEISIFIVLWHSAWIDGVEKHANKGGKFLKKLWCCVGGSITR